MATGRKKAESHVRNPFVTMGSEYVKKAVRERERERGRERERERERYRAKQEEEIDICFRQCSRDVCQVMSWTPLLTKQVRPFDLVVSVVHVFAVAFFLWITG